MLVSIKLSPLSSKIIQHEYKHKIFNNIICLDKSDQLYHILTCTPTYEKDFNSLSTMLTFSFPNSVGENIAWSTIGMKLHRLHRLQFVHDIQNDTRSISEFEKIREWLDMRNIQADEYNFEAALQTLKNFKKNTAKCCRTIQIPVLKNGNIRDPLSIDVLENVMTQFIANNYTHFTNVSKTPSKRLTKQLHIYTHRILGGMSLKEYELCFKIPERTQRHAIRQFSKFLAITKNLTPF
jgi:hypothetical protein